MKLGRNSNILCEDVASGRPINNFSIFHVCSLFMPGGSSTIYMHSINIVNDFLMQVRHGNDFTKTRLLFDVQVMDRLPPCYSHQQEETCSSSIQDLPRFRVERQRNQMLQSPRLSIQAWEKKNTHNHQKTNTYFGQMHQSPIFIY